MFDSELSKVRMDLKRLNVIFLSTWSSFSVQNVFSLLSQMLGSPMCFPLILSKLKTKVNQVMTLGLSILSLIHLFILKKKACNINQASISQCIFFLTFLLLNSLIYHHVLRCLTLINSHFFAFQNTVFKEHKGQY